MAYVYSTLTIDAISEMLATMASWQPVGGCASGLHPGDIGWNLAWPDEQCLPAVTVWRDATARIGAVALLDGPAEIRLTTEPALRQDPGLAATLFDDLTERFGDDPASVDLPAGPTLLAARLVTDGYASGDVLWPLLYRGLTGPPAMPAGISPIRETEFAARAEVEHSAFGSAVDIDRWARMHGRPGFDAGLDLVARTQDGKVAAGATAWSAGRGRPGLLEPVATHADHQRQGYGRRVVEGACAALAARGASGVSVHTPAFNTGAIAAYRAAGFAIIGWTAPLTRLR